MTHDTDSLKYWFATVLTFARRETAELLRDKIRLFFAVMGPIVIMAAVSWGISFDVQNLKYAVYDRKAARSPNIFPARAISSSSRPSSAKPTSEPCCKTARRYW